MDIRIKTTDYELSPETRSYLDERIASVERLLGDDAAAARCEVELGRDAGGQRHGEHVWFAEINISYPGASEIRATNRAESINAAIDDVKEEVAQQLRKQRTARQGFLRRSGAKLKEMMRWGSAE